jgi:hypothetical protein
MQDNTSTTGDHVSLLIEQPDLPDDEQQCEALLNDVETAVEAVLADHDLDAARLRTVHGHTYASIEADCPLCGDRLKLIEPRLEYTNGASARATCECGWRGNAIYRLVDLHENQSRTGVDEGTVDILEESSSVRLHDIQPMYTPY